MDHKTKIKFILNELFTNPKTNSISEVFSADYIAHTSKKKYIGLKIVSRWIKNLNDFFSDLKVSKLEFIYENEEIVVWKRTIKGKIKPSKNKKLTTGKTIKWEELVVSKFQNHLIKEEWISSEFLGALIPKK